MTQTAAKGWLFELFAYHMGESQRLQRAASAKGYGLNPVEFSRPYPASSTTVNMQSTTTKTDTATPQSPISTSAVSPATDAGTPAPAPSMGPRKTGWLASGLAALALAAGGIMTYLSMRAPAAPPAAASPLSPQDYQIDWSIDPSTGEMVISPPRRLD